MPLVERKKKQRRKVISLFKSIFLQDALQGPWVIDSDTQNLSRKITLNCAKIVESYPKSNGVVGGLKYLFYSMESLTKWARTSCVPPKNYPVSYWQKTMGYDIWPFLQGIVTNIEVSFWNAMNQGMLLDYCNLFVYSFLEKVKFSIWIVCESDAATHSKQNFKILPKKNEMCNWMFSIYLFKCGVIPSVIENIYTR